MKNAKTQNTELFFTKHAQTRMQQRSFSETDVMSILQQGTFITDKEVLFTRKDSEREIYNLHILIKRIERQISKKRTGICGTEIPESNNSLFSELAHLRQQIGIIERLKNRKVVISGNRVISCYSCSKSELKRISKIIN